MTRLYDTLLVVEQAAPATPASGLGAIYPKTDGRWYVKDDAGVERAVNPVLPRDKTWAIGGEITAATPVAAFPLFVPTGWTCALTRGRHRIESGTSMTWRLQRNGADITGWGTSGSPLSSTTTWTTVDPADVAVADLDYFDLVWGAATGTPTSWALGLEFLLTYTG